MTISIIFLAICYVNHRMTAKNIDTDRILLAEGRIVNGFSIRRMEDIFILEHNGRHVRSADNRKTLLIEAIPDDYCFAIVAMLSLLANLIT